MVERKTLNLVVVGSIPTGGAFCVPPGLRSGGQGLDPDRGLHREAALAQLGERKTEDLEVPGSIPGGGIFCKMSSVWPSGKASVSEAGDRGFDPLHGW